ncbi:MULTISPECIES: MCE family protein [Rhodococcus]|jgi:phospholipid/cholesterol/gamma-HCH transport system substrate-binding protein|uniref:ABC transporter substrate-binding protein n=1 Tax=Rhodococcus oxybenzonivorans TaxID=1990687 RepID=A0A2S2BSL3_9NOCA|nr:MULTISPECIES: MCE family protein [Rhodococcus]AWK71582.1 ABC transporter substrate-binding protein [Rhodococcus oxybenzonivorans]MDV7245048.1 MCE family protein [Rhodococcus oxybenzonivorans]MDV7266872.1 MCE family protein [Rhodococcus oxybenzonivorans]MDV7272669.1 MCE family protein [Rhodococcus oxybenzonivorans]MDV7336073.1 MCE family protein [Rhodococcus oxybenzonivorans]
MRKRRSPAVAGALGILVVLLATLSAFFLDSLPLIGAGSTYTAQFSEAAGLKPSNEVRIAGVKVGKVTAVELDGDHVNVDFKVTDAWVGNETSASIQIKTILGQKYLALDPRGSDSLNPNDPIPLERTTSPYDVVEAFSAAAETVGDIDSDQLAESMVTLSQAFEGTPSEIRASLDGVSRLSETIASRDQELRKLFDATGTTTKVLADRNAEFNRLITDAGLLLAELNSRQQSISQLLTGTQRLSQQLTGLVRENEATIGPALEQLNGVVEILKANNENLDRAMKLYEPFVRLYTNVVGNGRWFDQVVVNLLPPGLPDIPRPRDPVRTLGGN